jgi:hypothetical protein
LLRTRDAVLSETPARSATSCSVDLDPGTWPPLALSRSRALVLSCLTLYLRPA